MMSPTKTQIQNFPIKKNLNKKTPHTFRGFEQLSSSVSWRVMVVHSDVKKWLM